MLLLSRHDFPEMNSDEFESIKESKIFQHLFLQREIAASVTDNSAIADIGAQRFFHFLTGSPAKVKAVIDPYDGAGGNGLKSVPHLPEGLTLYQCGLGMKGSEIIPDNMFDVTFSCSVLEHIGQAECKYDCNPVNPPPEAQEAPRRAFARDLFRITKPGGVTFHTIDHAARNLTWFDNLEAAGFVPTFKGRRPTVEDALDGPDLVRERLHWTQKTPFPPEVQRLHGILYVRMRKPI